jgi:uncharacterized membrane protein YfcA
MNPPKDAMVFGHPIVAVPVTLTTIGIFWAAFSQGAGWWPLALLLLWPSYAVAKAGMARAAYLNWKRAWDGMAEPAKRKQPRGNGRKRGRPWLGVLMLAGLGFYFLTHASDPVYAVALVWLIVTLAVASLAQLIWRSRGNSARKGKDVPVAVCIARPLLSVPSLEKAYRGLPDHCRAVLRS